MIYLFDEMNLKNLIGSYNIKYSFTILSDDLISTSNFILFSLFYSG